MPNAKNLIGKGFDQNPDHILGKGRPKKIPSVEILLADVFTEKERVSILTSLKKQALKGNIRAIEVILDRLYGRVKQQTELTGSIVTQPITGMIILRDDNKIETSG